MPSSIVVKKDLTGLEPSLPSPVLPSNKQPGPIFFDNGAPGQIAATGEPLFLDDTRMFESFLHHPDEEKQIGSYIGIPLKNENRIVGVMAFSNSSISSYRVEDFDLLRTLSHIISAGIEKGRPLQEDAGAGARGRVDRDAELPGASRERWKRK